MKNKWIPLDKEQPIRDTRVYLCRMRKTVDLGDEIIWESEGYL